MTDTLPIVSQIKSILQLLFGQTSQALETQINFLDATPLLSQLKSLHELFVSKDFIKAMETQKKFLIITNHTIDNIPVVGHIKGLGHYLIGDFSNGNAAVKRSSRTTVVILCGYFACTIVIPATSTATATITASAIGSMIGGAAMDTLITLFENVMHKDASLMGHYNAFANVVKNPFDVGSLFDLIMGPILDGLIGAFIGCKVYQFRNPPILPPVPHVIDTKTVRTLPPPPPPPLAHPPLVHLSLAHPPLPPPPIYQYVPSIISNNIPLPPPFNPWKYGVAAATLQRHARHN